MADSISSQFQDMANLTPSARIRLVWPDDYMSVGSNEQYVSIEQESVFNCACSMPDCHICRKRRVLFRPQVTVNVFSSGGSSVGGSSVGGNAAGGSGSAAGGSGTGGSSTLNGGYAPAGQGDLLPLLSSKLAELQTKVEQLSTQVSAQPIVIESGIWNTTSVRPWQQTQHATEGRVNFSKIFKSITSVTASICSVDVSDEANTRVKVYVTSITTNGFTVHADSWGDTKLYSCEVSWLAIGE